MHSCMHGLPHARLCMHVCSQTVWKLEGCIFTLKQTIPNNVWNIQACVNIPPPPPRPPHNPTNRQSTYPQSSCNEREPMYYKVRDWHPTSGCPSYVSAESKRPCSYIELMDFMLGFSGCDFLASNLCVVSIGNTQLSWEI